jgi:SLA1 Homology Domain 1 (SHD1) protein
MYRRFLRQLIIGCVFLVCARPSQGDGATGQSGLTGVRNWTDSTGRFHTLGALVDGNQSSVRIKKQTTGTIITVSRERLSAQDRAFVGRALEPAQRSDRSESRGRTGERVNRAPQDNAKSPLELLKDLAVNSPLATGLAKAQGPSAPADSDSSRDHGRAADDVRLPENMVYVRLSKPLLARLVRQDFSRRSAVEDDILGTPITGVTQTFGHAELELQSHPDVGLGQIHFGGTINFDTVGCAGPVQIFTRGVTQFQSVKTIWLDGQGVHLAPSATNASTQSTTTGITTSLPRLRGRISLRIAQSRVAESHAQADEITSQHAARRIDRRFDASAAEEVAQLRNIVNTKLSALPADNPLRPRGWHARSKPEFLEIVLLGPPGDGSGYVPAPSANLGAADVRVDIHAAVVKTAMTDPAARSILQAVAVSLASRPGASSEMPSVAWSDDSQWLSIAWQLRNATAPLQKSSGPAF